MAGMERISTKLLKQILSLVATGNVTLELASQYQLLAVWLECEELTGIKIHINYNSSELEGLQTKYEQVAGRRSQ